MAASAALTAYGEVNPLAPPDLGTFAFLIGKWNGQGVALRPDGGEARFEMTWIGRYVLDGMAVADEFHAAAPDGKPYLGISLRQFLPQQGWIIEYLNVSGSFIRRQVGPRRGSVRREANVITVISEDGDARIRERYQVIDADHFTYATDQSSDGGRTWGAVTVRIELARAPQ